MDTSSTTPKKHGSVRRESLRPIQSPQTQLRSDVSSFLKTRQQVFQSLMNGEATRISFNTAPQVPDFDERPLTPPDAERPAPSCDTIPTITGDQDEMDAPELPDLGADTRPGTTASTQQEVQPADQESAEPRILCDELAYKAAQSLDISASDSVPVPRTTILRAKLLESYDSGVTSFIHRTLLPDPDARSDETVPPYDARTLEPYSQMELHCRAATDPSLFSDDIANSCAPCSRTQNIPAYLRSLSAVVSVIGTPRSGCSSLCEEVARLVGESCVLINRSRLVTAASEAKTALSEAGITADSPADAVQEVTGVSKAGDALVFTDSAGTALALAADSVLGFEVAFGMLASPQPPELTAMAVLAAASMNQPINQEEEKLYPWRAVLIDSVLTTIESLTRFEELLGCADINSMLTLRQVKSPPKGAKQKQVQAQEAPQRDTVRCNSALTHIVTLDCSLQESLARAVTQLADSRHSLVLNPPPLLPPAMMQELKLAPFDAQEITRQHGQISALKETLKTLSEDDATCPRYSPELLSFPALTGAADSAGEIEFKANKPVALPEFQPSASGAGKARKALAHQASHLGYSCFTPPVASQVTLSSPSRSFDHSSSSITRRNSEATMDSPRLSTGTPHTRTRRRATQRVMSLRTAVLPEAESARYVAAVDAAYSEYRAGLADLLLTMKQNTETAHCETLEEMWAFVETILANRTVTAVKDWYQCPYTNKQEAQLAMVNHMREADALRTSLASTVPTEHTPEPMDAVRHVAVLELLLSVARIELIYRMTVIAQGISESPEYDEIFTATVERIRRMDDGSLPIPEGRPLDAEGDTVLNALVQQLDATRLSGLQTMRSSSSNSSLGAPLILPTESTEAIQAVLAGSRSELRRLELLQTTVTRVVATLRSDAARSTREATMAVYSWICLAARSQCRSVTQHSQLPQLLPVPVVDVQKAVSCGLEKCNAPQPPPTIDDVVAPGCRRFLTQSQTTSAIAAFSQLPPILAVIPSTLPPSTPPKGKAAPPSPPTDIQLESCWTTLQAAATTMCRVLQTGSENEWSDLLQPVAVPILIQTEPQVIQPPPPTGREKSKASARQPEIIYGSKEIQIVNWPMLLANLASPRQNYVDSPSDGVMKEAISASVGALGPLDNLPRNIYEFFNDNAVIAAIGFLNSRADLELPPRPPKAPLLPRPEIGDIITKNIRETLRIPEELGISLEQLCAPFHWLPQLL